MARISDEVDDKAARLAGGSKIGMYSQRGSGRTYANYNSFLKVP